MAYTAEDIRIKAEALLGGTADEGRKTAVAAVCEAARAEMTARLLNGVTPEDIGETFVTACGLLAISMCIESGNGDVASFKAGSVAVTRKGGSGGISAASLRRQAEEMLKAYLADSGFAFVGVRG